MKTNLKRVLSLVCALALCIGMLPMSALAAEPAGPYTDSVSTESDGVVLNKEASYDSTTGEYSLTMEAYVTNEVTSTTVTKPLDIVLVLDVSGSMDDNITSYTYQETQRWNWSYEDIDVNWQTYYYKDGDSYYEVRHSRSNRYWVQTGDLPWEGEWVRDYTLYYVDGNGTTHQLGNTVHSSSETILTDTTLYTRRSGGEISKIQAMKTAVNSFIDQVATNAAGDPADPEDNVTHRISIVKFAGRNSDNIGNNTYQDGRYTYNHSQVVTDLTDVSSNLEGLKSTINRLRAAGATSVDYGLNHAQRVLNGDSDGSLKGARENAKKVVVVFTDGEPNHDNDFDPVVAANAVNLAHDLKATEGENAFEATVYTIGVFNGANASDITSNFNKYMNGVSSNYPEATAPNSDGWTSWNSLSLGDRAAGDYYFAASDADELEDAFDTIADSVGKSEVVAGVNTVLTDTLSGYFTFPEGLDGNSSSVIVQKVPVTGVDGEGNYTWDTAGTLTGVTVTVDKENKTIKVNGFDYTANAVTKTTNADGTVSWSGAKLVLTFPIELDPEGTWGVTGNYPTNSLAENSQAGLDGYKVAEEDGSLWLDNSEPDGSDGSPEVPVTTYRVTYNPNASDTTGSVTDSNYYISEEIATVLENDFVCDGYRFTGWNTAADGSGTSYEAKATITMTSDVTLYAQWVATTASYTVEHYLEDLDGNGYTLEETENKTGTTGESVTAQSKTYEGFTFDEDNANNVLNGTVAADGSLVLKLYYTRNSYTVTYKYDGDVPEGASLAPKPATYKYGAEVTVAPGAIPPEGYEFIGWSTSDADISNGSFTMPANDVVLHGSFSTIGVYTVIYDLNGGTTSSTQTEFTGLKLGDETPTIENPTKEPNEYYTYEFIGWSPEVQDTVAGNMTYVAQYDRDVREFTVTYKVNDVVVGTETYTFGSDVEVRPQYEGATPWETDNLTEDDIIGGWFWMPAHDVVFTAETDGPVVPGECTYSVISHYIDRDGTQVGVVHDTALVSSTIGTPVEGLYRTDNTTFGRQNYVFGRAELNGVEIIGGETLAAGTNTIDVYYDIDDIDRYNPDEPGPDGIPDKDQVVFTYQSNDPDLGAVSLIKEVGTKGSNGYAEAPKATALPYGENRFLYWIDDYYEVLDTDAGMKNMPQYYDEDTTFTAHFEKSPEPETYPDIHVYFEAVNGTFENVGATYTVSVEADKDGNYVLTEGDILTALPFNDLNYETDGVWTLNSSACEEPVPGTAVEDGDYFVVTFQPKDGPATVTVSYEWVGDAPFNMDPPSTDFVTAGSEYTVKNPPIRVEDENGTWYFLGWYYDEARSESCPATIDSVTESVVLYGFWDFQENPEEPGPTPSDERFLVIKESDQTSVTVGDTITWTITIASMTGEQLTLTVRDEQAERLTYADGTEVGGTVTVPAWEYVTLYAEYTTTEEDADKEIVNTVVVDDPNDEEDQTEEEAPPVYVEPYTITISPANMTIYTGGVGYGGVTGENDEIIEGTESSGLPRPGFYFDLPQAVTDWLTEHGVTLDGENAANLANVLDFCYYDEDGDEIRHWDLEDQGVYSRDNAGSITRYVYSLSPNTIPGDAEGVEVRLQFTDDGNIVTDDNIRMDENTVFADYEVTIYGGGLDQSEIKAMFTVGEGEEAESITCNVKVGAGSLIIKSVTDEGTTTNEIVSAPESVESDTLTAVDNNNVVYYVNDSEVEVPAERVELLVDQISNSDDFNRAMGQDAIEKIVENTNLSNASYKLAYLDLVDTENGNAVVTMGTNEDGTNQSLTIYWPVPDNAASNSDFHIVHYTGMDRQTVMGEDDLSSAAKATPEVKIVTIGNQRYVTFTTDSFSPFVLVYEAEDTTEPDPDPDTPSRPSHRPDRDDEPEDLNTEDHVGYLIGFTDGTIRPEDDISRAEVATIFFRLLTDEARETYWSQTNSYSDVAPDAWYNNAVSTLSNMGILDGYLDGTFRPNAPITRSEFTKIAVSFFDYAAEEYSYEGWFSDVQGREWFVEYLTAAIEYGLIEGMPDGTFRPLDNITRAEAATIVNRTLGREPHEDYLLSRREMITWPDNSTSAWYYADMQEATNSHDYAWIVINEDEDDEMEVEEWTDKLDERDWAELEQTWSDAYDAPGGEVMD